MPVEVLNKPEDHREPYLAQLLDVDEELSQKIQILLDAGELSETKRGFRVALKLLRWDL